MIYSVLILVASRFGLRIKHIAETNLRTKSMLALYIYIICYVYFNSSLKWLYINNKTERFTYKGGCSVTHIKSFKRRASLGYR